MMGKSSSPDHFDLERLENWLAANNPASSAMMSKLIRLERIVNTAFRSDVRLSYTPVLVDGVLEIVIETKAGGHGLRRASMTFCCYAGRFFKRYGPASDERLFFKGADDAAHYLIYVAGEGRTPVRRRAVQQIGHRSVR